MRAITTERAIIFSIILHLLLLIGLRAAPPSWAQPDLAPPNVAEIEIIEKKPAAKTAKKQPQVIRDVQVPDRMREDDNDQEARFLSAERRRVVAETQARESGLTHNGARSLPANSWMRHYPPAQKQLQPKPQASKFAPKWQDFNGYEPIAIPKASAETGSREAFQDAPSTVGEALPNDVALGDFTALNTDRFKFYSFFSRVEELIRFRWETNLRQAVDSFPRDYLVNVVGRRQWVTKIEFWITPDGHFHSAHIHQESGVKRFDFAAVNAFREAAVFPNPPRELVEDDGMIHLQYSFNVRWNPSLLSDR